MSEQHLGCFDTLGMNPPSILLVDDDEALLRSLSRGLAPLGKELLLATTGPTAVELMRQRKPAVVISDVHLNEAHGVELISSFRSIDPTASIVLITGLGSVSEAVLALKRGAFDYLLKTEFGDEGLRDVVQRGLAAASSKRHAADSSVAGTTVAPTSVAPTTVAPTSVVSVPVAESSDEFFGSCETMQRVFRSVDTVASTDATVLILGESGTGKELTAASVHKRSARSKRPFVAVNCSALSETLLQSELFGHQRGAFTGAEASRKGLFEAAHGGTIFLDEIGHISPSVQASLLRVLQEREVRRLGSSESVKVDVRVVAATNVDLAEAVKAKTFREDLYYRLNVVAIRLPALRDRGDDVVHLARRFLARYAADLKRPAKQFSAEALQLLRQHRWPGNVRELQNAVYRAVLMSDGETLERESLPLRADLQPELGQASVSVEAPIAVPVAAVDGEQPYAELRKGLIDQFHHAYLEALLRRSNGNLSQAARISGIDRTNLRRMLKEHGLRE